MVAQLIAMIAAQNVARDNNKKAQDNLIAKLNQYLKDLDASVALVPAFISEEPEFQKKVTEMRSTAEQHLATTRSYVPAWNKGLPYSWNLPEPASQIGALAENIYKKKVENAPPAPTAFFDAAGNEITEEAYIILSEKNGDVGYIGPDGKEWPKDSWLAIQKNPFRWADPYGNPLGPAMQAAFDKQNPVQYLLNKEIDIDKKFAAVDEKPPKDNRKPGMHFMSEPSLEGLSGDIVRSTIPGDKRDPLKRLGMAVLKGDKKGMANLEGEDWWTDSEGTLYFLEGEIRAPTEEEVQQQIAEAQKLLMDEKFINQTLESKINGLQQNLSKHIKKDSILRSVNAASMALAGIIVGLMAVPVIGWIIALILAIQSAVLSLVNKPNQIEVKMIIGNTQKRIDAYQTAKDMEVQRAALAVYDKVTTKAIADVKAEVASMYVKLGLDKPFPPAEFALGDLGNPLIQMMQAGWAQGAAAMAAGAAQWAQAVNQNAQQFARSTSTGAANLAKMSAAAQQQMSSSIMAAQRQMYSAMVSGWENATGQKKESRSDKLKGKIKKLDPSRWIKKGINWFEKANKEVFDAAKEVDDRITGQYMVEKTRKRMAEIEAMMTTQVNLITHNQIKQLQSPAYQNVLYAEVRKALMQSPLVKAVLGEMYEAAAKRNKYLQTAQKIKLIDQQRAAMKAPTFEKEQQALAEEKIKTAELQQAAKKATAPIPPTEAEFEEEVFEPEKKKSIWPWVVAAGTAAYVALGD